ncbi:SitA6 family polymorphic toxin lipoprotein [Hyalangium gracile]|uniref:SitA6 family polymorphic toxin lipoprotein n=1 Tax=Hyalangium gracile TaxID=394092 RepID=UPI001CC91867|nr:TIGR02269 family lipoprotein [Hyalangium gracile]
MVEVFRGWVWLLLCAGLTACASTQVSLGEEVEEGERVASFEELCAEEESLLPLCDGQQCGLYRCREVMGLLQVGQVVPARTGGMVLPIPGGTAQRYWGSADGLPKPSQPVFIIPWGPKPEPLPSQKKLLEQWAEEWRKPHEKHHIFPQEPGLKRWFASKGINVHDYTMPLLVDVHRRIHHPPPSGGAWNEAWRKYQQAHFDAPKEEIFRYAGQLLYEFQLLGPVVPYYRRWTQPPPVGNW